MTPPPPSGPPQLSIEGGIARIVLRRPEQHNAIGAGDVALLRDHLAAVDRTDSVRVLTITGAGDDTFCSGASLPEIEAGDMSGSVFQTLTGRLAAARVPTVAALNGSVFGGGAEVALACDFRIGVRGSRLGVPAARLGICYPADGIDRFVRTLGLTAARRILLAGEELDAEEMVRVGFLDRLVAPDELGRACDELARRLAALAPLAVQAMKRILAHSGRGSLDEGEVHALVARCEQSTDLREGLRARREDREPAFRGH